MRTCVALVLLVGCGRCGEGPPAPETTEPTASESASAAAEVEAPEPLPPPEPRPKPAPLTSEQLEAVRASQHKLREGRRLAHEALWDQAATKFRESIEHGESATARCELGWALFQLAELAAAKEELERGAALLGHRRHRERERNTLGACLYNLGRAVEETDPDAAAAHYRASLEARPNRAVEARLAQLGAAEPPAPRCEPSRCEGPFPDSDAALAAAELDDESEGAIGWDEASGASVYELDRVLAFLPFDAGWYVCELGTPRGYSQTSARVSAAQWIAGGEPEFTIRYEGYDSGNEEGINNAMGIVLRHFVGRRGEDVVVYGDLVVLDYYDDAMWTDCDCEEGYASFDCCELEDVSSRVWTRVAYADSGQLRLTRGGRTQDGRERSRETEVVRLDQLACRPEPQAD